MVLFGSSAAKSLQCRPQANPEHRAVQTVGEFVYGAGDLIDVLPQSR